ncbi:MAG: hypothetical protein EBZ77_12460 [Chitinophagia bacterium]|nr:hypothetical protein [Chitinophagia bacterium]
MQRLIQNNINVVRFARDTTLEVTAYNIDNYETGPRPYEGHYLHRNITVTTRTTRISFLKGDWYVPLQQRGKRFIVEALEPTAPDGFFAWNYFDGVLSQKEYFGDYVFEDVAAEELKRNPALQQELKEKQRTDTTFAKNAQAQLDFIYRSAGFLEPGYLRYPVYRVEQ